MLRADRDGQERDAESVGGTGCSHPGLIDRHMSVDDDVLAFLAYLNRPCDSANLGTEDLIRLAECQSVDRSTSLDWPPLNVRLFARWIRDAIGLKLAPDFAANDKG